jgi:hypothetical protein
MHEAKGSSFNKIILSLQGLLVHASGANMTAYANNNNSTKVSKKSQTAARANLKQKAMMISVKIS